MIKLWLFIFFWGLFFQVNAQSNKQSAQGVLQGTVVEIETSKAISGAVVELYNLVDSTKKQRTLTDKNGFFEIDKIEMGFYKLTIKAGGFGVLQIDSIFFRAERYDFNLGDLKLKPTAEDLQEVIVYAEKPLIENKDGKLVFNAGESVMSASSSTAEILKTLPLVSNDPNGKVLLKGKEPRILIDEKPVDLSADQLRDLLESLPGSTIEKIELMTNPPPEYASESGGVINIVTKKGKIGFTGKVSISAGTRGEGNFTANGSYRKKGFSLSATIGLNGSTLMGNSYSYRQNIFKDSTNRFNTNGNFTNKNLRPNFRVQADYELNKYQQLNFTYQGNLNYFDNINNTSFSFINRFNELYAFNTRENNSIGNGYNHNYTAAYTLKSAKHKGEQWKIIGNVALGKNDNDRDFYQQFLTGTFLPLGDSAQNQFFNNYINNYSVRVNYDRPLTKQIQLSTGITWQQTLQKSVLNTSFKSFGNEFIPNELLSNDFRFTMDIYTARAAVVFSLPKNWKLTSGFSVEQTNTNFTFFKGNVANSANTYTNVLPTINLRKDFSKDVNAALVYRATIRRPGIAELNPNIDYSDPYNIRFGNPFLLPVLAHNFDANFSITKGKYYLNTSLGFNTIQNIYNTIRSLNNDGKTQTTWLNIAGKNEYEASIWGGYTFSKKMRMNASAAYTFNQYGNREKLLYRYVDGNSFNTSVNYFYTPTSTLTFEGNVRFSSFATPQGRTRSNLNMNIGAQKKLFNKRLIISVNIIDPITVQQTITYTAGSNFNIESFNAANTRNFRVSVSYMLNKMVKKSTLNSKTQKQIIDQIKQKSKKA